jgi:hypothetical protein
MKANEIKIGVNYIVTKSDNDKIFVGDTLMIRSENFDDWKFSLFLPVRYEQKDWHGMKPMTCCLHLTSKEHLLKELKTVEVGYNINVALDLIKEYEEKILKIKKDYELTYRHKPIEKHQMHKHETLINLYNIPDTQCIIDIEFASGFKHFELIENDNEHIIVSCEEFDEIVSRRYKMNERPEAIRGSHLSYFEQQIEYIKTRFNKSWEQVKDLYNIIEVTYPYLSEAFKVDLLEDTYVYSNYSPIGIAHCLNIVASREKYLNIE